MEPAAKTVHTIVWDGDARASPQLLAFFKLLSLFLGLAFPAHFRNSKWMLHINLCTEGRTRRMCLWRQGVKVTESPQVRSGMPIFVPREERNARPRNSPASPASPAYPRKPV
ncbi:hypothetical protein PVAP13_5NG017700 [Panicum virgatum]|uniref:Uncharacterized protein n=1 Tax=Panicum virgatum TaxID=38727 RepID=A0A8T0RYM2_PANVG|nr:hypothetical protein PVAP13_5NG017700 [Panicum virgatum]